MYDSDRGLEELASRRGGEQVSFAALADRMRDFVDAHPQFESGVEQLAVFLARDEEDWD